MDNSRTDPKPEVYFGEADQRPAEDQDKSDVERSEGAREMTDQTQNDTEHEKLRAEVGRWIADPMWADHAEVPKALLKKVHAALDGGAVSRNLHPDTSALIDRFAEALKDKLAAAEKKYGYSDGWMRDDWQSELIDKLQHHVIKGDPRDVAAYCAFAWHHGWPITPQQRDGGAVQCSMGVGCDEVGVCYADANGQPERCPRIPQRDGGAASRDVNEVIAWHDEQVGKWIEQQRLELNLKRQRKADHALGFADCHKHAVMSLKAYLKTGVFVPPLKTAALRTPQQQQDEARDLALIEFVVNAAVTAEQNEALNSRALLAAFLVAEKGE